MQVRKWVLSYREEGMPSQGKKIKWFNSIDLLSNFLSGNPQISVKVITREA